MRNIEDIYALSPMQQLMLFHARMAARTDDVLFNQIVYQIQGNLDPDSYRRAWQLVVDRHPALRTVFVWQDGKDPLQIVRREVALPWNEHDWQALTDKEQETKLNSLLAEDQATGFDLLKAPLMRVNLIRAKENSYLLVWSSHHLIIDRWCIGIIFDETARSYEAFTANQVPRLEPSPRYSDYIKWIAEQDPSEMESYWKESLRSVSARPLPLKSDAIKGADSTTRRSSISGEDWDLLRSYAASYGLTIGTLVTAAWGLVLGVATGAADTLFGVTVSGRPAELPNVDRAVGSFINNKPMRVPINGQLALVDWLHDVQQRGFSSEPYEHASLAQIQAWSGLSVQGTLFDSLLVIQSPVEIKAPADLSVKLMRGGMQTGYPVSLAAVPGEDNLRLVVTYDMEQVAADLIGQMETALRQLLLLMPSIGKGRLQELIEQVPMTEMQIHAAEPDSLISAVNKGAASSQELSEYTLTQIWTEVLEVSRIGAEDRFYELGGDSIKALRLLMLIEQRMDKKVPISLLFGDPTLSQMAESIGERVAFPIEDPVLVPLNTKGTRPPIFFAHGVFGSLAWLTNLLPLLDQDQPAYGLQAIGLQSNAEPDSTIEAMASRYVESIRQIQPSGPYYLAGFCFGGVVAYEVARQLEALDEDISLLAIIDGFPPQTSLRRRPLYDPLRLKTIRRSAPYWLRGYEEFGGWRLRERLQARFKNNDNPEFDVEINAVQLGEMEYLAAFAGASEDKQRHVLGVHHLAADSYEPQQFGGQVTLFCARLLGIRHAISGPVDPQRGWDRLAKGGVAVRYIEGSHVGLLTNPHVTDLAHQLNRELEEKMNGNQQPTHSSSDVFRG